MNLKSSVILATGRWSQQTPYNAQYPSNYFMGCVPIALGQIMFYHKHPVRGKGVLVAQGDKPEVLLSEQEYDWGLIPQVLLQSDHEDKIQMTSTLVMHVARACKIQPNPGTVGTGIDDAITALVENFYYDRNIAKLSIYDEELCYTYREIMDISRGELNLGQPIYVSIKGHAITCNGYDQDNNNFLCNWGWGQADGWTTLDKNGCDPLHLIIGIRPSEDDVIFLNNYSSDFDGRFYNDKGLVSFSA